MEKINDVICRTIHNFMKDRIDEIVKCECGLYFSEKEMWNMHGYSGPKQFLSRVKHNIDDALYAFTEIMACHMFRYYVDDYVCKNEGDYGKKIFIMFDIDNQQRYFYIDYSGNNMKPIEVKKIKKVIEVETFEKV